MRILIIIPAYNEAENILGVITELRQQIPNYDYLVINDGSTDATLSILRQAKIPHLNLGVNLGIGGVVQTGYIYALENDYDIAIQLDGDGQHDPAQIVSLLTPLINNEADLIIGSRFLDGHTSAFRSTWLRRLGIRWISQLLFFCTGVRIHDATSGFRATNRSLIAFYARDYAQDYPEPEAILCAALAGFKLKEVPVQMRERQGGVSSINSLQPLYYMLKVSLAILLRRLGLINKGV